MKIDREKLSLSAPRLGILRRIRACYGPWFLLRLNVGKWQAVWHSRLEEDEEISDVIRGVGSNRSELRFRTRTDALKCILDSIEQEAQYYGEAYSAIKKAVLDDLLQSMDGVTDGDERDYFAGTQHEARLLRTWAFVDHRRRLEIEKLIAEKKAHNAARLEQERREHVFARLLAIFGNEIVDAINATILDVWVNSKPKLEIATKGGGQQGDPRPMPRLEVIDGRVAYRSPSRLSPIAIKTPLSKWNDRIGIDLHWRYDAWANITVPRIAEVIDEFERAAQQLDANGKLGSVSNQ